MPLASDPCTLFWKEGNAAVAAGLMREHELFTICRPKTRKQNYWDKHLEVLRDTIKDRQELREQVRQSQLPPDE